MSEDLIEQNQQTDMVDSASTPALSPESSVSQEKMLRQSEVNELAGRIRSEAFEKGRAQAEQEMMMRASMQEPAKSSEPVSAQQVAQGALSEDQVKMMIEAEARKFQEEQAQKMMAEKIVGEFSSKMESGPAKYDDFDETVQQLDLRSIPDIVQLANSVPNTEDIMYDLGKNPYKIGNLKVLAQTSPQLALAEINRLSKSIVSNESAKRQVENVKEPLSQMKPTTMAVDNGELSVKDLRNASWLKR